MSKPKPKEDIITGDIYPCLFCKVHVTEVRDPYSGVLDYHDDGDFGCGDNPISGEEGTGPHLPLTLDNLKAIAEMLTGEKYMVYKTAPGLLDALMGCHRYMTTPTIEHTSRDAHAIAEKAGAAIAKGEGR